MKEIDFLIGQIAKHQLDNNSRHRSYVYKRYYIMYRLNKCKVSLTQIGKMLNVDINHLYRWRIKVNFQDPFRHLSDEEVNEIMVMQTK